MILNIGRRSYTRTKLGDISRTTHLLQVAALGQLVGYGKHVNRLFLHTQVAYGGINHLVAGFVETLGAQYLADYSIRVLINHQRTKHSLLHLGSLRLQMTVRRIERLVALSSSIICLFCHICY